MRTLDSPITMYHTLTDTVTRYFKLAYGSTSGLVKGSQDAAAFDLQSRDHIRIHAGEQYLIGTGLRLALPLGTCGLVLPRSGLASKHGITIVNSPGLIDEDYRGEVMVTLTMPLRFSDLTDYKNGTAARRFYDIKKHDRIAQLLIVDVRAVTPFFLEQPEFDERWLNTERGQDGFGSTGR